MIDQGLGYPAIKRRLRQVAQADFSRTPFPAGVVQAAAKRGFWIMFWFFSHSHTFYSICDALPPSISSRRLR
jgi:hypothetical protein